MGRDSTEMQRTVREMQKAVGDMRKAVVSMRESAMERMRAKNPSAPESAVDSDPVFQGDLAMATVKLQEILSKHQELQDIFQSTYPNETIYPPRIPGSLKSGNSNNKNQLSSSLPSSGQACSTQPSSTQTPRKAQASKKTPPQSRKTSQELKQKGKKTEPAVKIQTAKPSAAKVAPSSKISEQCDLTLDTAVPGEQDLDQGMKSETGKRATAKMSVEAGGKVRNESLTKERESDRLERLRRLEEELAFESEYGIKTGDDGEIEYYESVGLYDPFGDIAALARGPAYEDMGTGKDLASTSLVELCKLELEGRLDSIYNPDDPAAVDLLRRLTEEFPFLAEPSPMQSAFLRAAHAAMMYNEGYSTDPYADLKTPQPSASKFVATQAIQAEAMATIEAIAAKLTEVAAADMTEVQQTTLDAQPLDAESQLTLSDPSDSERQLGEPESARDDADKSVCGMTPVEISAAKVCGAEAEVLPAEVASEGRSETSGVQGETSASSDEGLVAEGEEGSFAGFPYSDRFWYMPLVRCPRVGTVNDHSGCSSDEEPRSKSARHHSAKACSAKLVEEERVKVETVLERARNLALQQCWGSRLRLQRLTEQLKDQGVRLTPDEHSVLVRKRRHKSVKRIPWDRLYPTECEKTTVPSTAAPSSGQTVDMSADDLRVDALLNKEREDFFVDHLCDQNSRWVRHIKMEVDVASLNPKKAFASPGYPFGDLTLGALFFVSKPAAAPAGADTRSRGKTKKLKKGAKPSSGDVARVSACLSLQPPLSRSSTPTSRLWCVPTVYYSCGVINVRKNEVSESTVVWGVKTFSADNSNVALPRIITLDELTAKNSPYLNAQKKVTFCVSVVARFSDQLCKILTPGDYKERRIRRQHLLAEKRPFAEDSRDDDAEDWTSSTDEKQKDGFEGEAANSDSAAKFDGDRKGTGNREDSDENSPQNQTSSSEGDLIMDRLEASLYAWNSGSRNFEAIDVPRSDTDSAASSPHEASSLSTHKSASSRSFGETDGSPKSLSFSTASASSCTHKDNFSAHKIHRTKRHRKVQNELGLLCAETEVRTPGPSGAVTRFGFERSFSVKRGILPQLATLLPFHQLGVFGSPSQAFAKYEPIVQATLRSGVLRMVLSFTRSIRYKDVMRTLHMESLKRARSNDEPTCASLEITEKTLKALGVSGNYLHSERVGDGSSLTPVHKLPVPEYMEMGNNNFRLPTLSVLLVATVKQALASQSRQPTRRLSLKWVYRILRLVAEISGSIAALEAFDILVIVKSLRSCLIDAMEDCCVFFEAETMMSYPRDMLRNCLTLAKSTVVTSSSGQNYVIDCSTAYGLTYTLDWTQPTLEDLILKAQSPQTLESYLLPDGSIDTVTKVDHMAASPVEFAIDFVCDPSTSPNHSFLAPEYLAYGRTEPEIYTLVSVLAVIPSANDSHNSGKLVAFVKDEITGLWEICVSDSPGLFPLPQTRQFVDAMSRLSADARELNVTACTANDLFATRPPVQSELVLTASDTTREFPWNGAVEAGRMVNLWEDSAAFESLQIVLNEMDTWTGPSEMAKLAPLMHVPGHWEFNPYFLPLQLIYGRVDYLTKFNAYWQPRGRALAVVPFFFDESILRVENNKCTLCDQVLTDPNNHVCLSTAQLDNFALTAFNFQEGIDISEPDCPRNYASQEIAGKYAWTLTLPTFDSEQTLWTESSFPPAHVCPSALQPFWPAEETFETETSTDPSEPCVLLSGEDDDSATSSDECTEAKTGIRGVYARWTFGGGDRSVTGAECSAKPDQTWSAWFDKNDTLPTLELGVGRRYAPSSGESSDSDGSIASNTRGNCVIEFKEGDARPPILASKIAQECEMQKMMANKAREPEEMSSLNLTQQQLHYLQQSPEPLMRSAITATLFRSSHRFAQSAESCDRAIDVFVLDECQFFSGYDTKGIHRVLTGQASAVANKLANNTSTGPRKWLDASILSASNFELSLVFKAIGAGENARTLLGQDATSREALYARWQSLPTALYLSCHVGMAFGDLCLLLTLLHKEGVDNAAFFALGVGHHGAKLEPVSPNDKLLKHAVPQSKSRSPMVFLLGVRKPGSLMTPHIFNVFATAKQLATVSLAETVRHAEGAVKDDSVLCKHLPLLVEHCSPDPNCRLLFVRFWDTYHFGQLYLGTLMTPYGSELNEFSSVFQMAASKKLNRLLTMQRDTLTVLKQSNDVTAGEKDYIDDTYALLENALKQVNLLTNGKTHLMMFEEAADGTLMPLPQKLKSIGEICGPNRNFLNLVVQITPPGYTLCTVCQQAIPLDVSISRDYGCCSVKCESAAFLAHQTKKFLPTSMASIPEQIEVVLDAEETAVIAWADLLGSYTVNGETDVTGRPVWEKWSVKGRRIVTFVEESGHWEIRGALDLDPTGELNALAYSEQAVFTSNPSEVSKWWLYGPDGTEEAPKGFRVEILPEIVEPPDHMALGCGGNGVLGLYRRRRFKVDGKAVYTRTPETADSDCFGTASIYFDSNTGRWNLGVALEPTLLATTAAASKWMNVLASSEPNWGCQNPASAQWTILSPNASKPSSMPLKMFEGVQAQHLWRPLLLTIMSDIPGLASGEYVLPTGCVDATYDYAASPNGVRDLVTFVNERGRTVRPHLLLRILDLPGYIICFAFFGPKSCENVLLKLQEGDRSNGVWGRITNTPLTKPLSVKGETARIIAMSELPAVLHVVTNETSAALRGTYFLVSQLLNFRPVYVRLQPNIYGDKFFEAAPPLAPEYIDDLMLAAIDYQSTGTFSDLDKHFLSAARAISEAPPIFLFYSGTSETWTFSTVCGGGAAICESEGTQDTHHPGYPAAKLLENTAEKSEVGRGGAFQILYDIQASKELAFSQMFSMSPCSTTHTRGSQNLEDDQRLGPYSHSNTNLPRGFGPLNFYNCETGDPAYVTVVTLSTDSVVNCSRITYNQNSPLQELGKLKYSGSALSAYKTVESFSENGSEQSTLRRAVVDEILTVESKTRGSLTETPSDLCDWSTDSEDAEESSGFCDYPFAFDSPCANSLCDLTAFKKRRRRNAVWDTLSRDHMLVPRELSVSEVLRRRLRRLGRTGLKSSADEDGTLSPLEGDDEGDDTARMSQTVFTAGSRKKHDLNNLHVMLRQGGLWCAERAVVATAAACNDSAPPITQEAMLHSILTAVESSATTRLRKASKQQPENQNRVSATTVDKQSTQQTVEDILAQVEPSAQANNANKKKKRSRKKKNGQEGSVAETQEALAEEELSSPEARDTRTSDTAAPLRTTTTASVPEAEVHQDTSAPVTEEQPLTEKKVARGLEEALQTAPVTQETAGTSSFREKDRPSAPRATLDLSHKVVTILLTEGQVNAADISFRMYRDKDLATAIRQGKAKYGKSLTISALIRQACAKWLQVLDGKLQLLGPESIAKTLSDEVAHYLKVCHGGKTLMLQALCQELCGVWPHLSLLLRDKSIVANAAGHFLHLGGVQNLKDDRDRRVAESFGKRLDLELTADELFGFLLSLGQRGLSEKSLILLCDSDGSLVILHGKSGPLLCDTHKPINSFCEKKISDWIANDRAKRRVVTPPSPQSPVSPPVTALTLDRQVDTNTAATAVAPILVKTKRDRPVEAAADDFLHCPPPGLDVPASVHEPSTPTITSIKLRESAELKRVSSLDKVQRAEKMTKTPKLPAPKAPVIETGSYSQSPLVDTSPSVTEFEPVAFPTESERRFNMGMGNGFGMDPSMTNFTPAMFSTLPEATFRPSQTMDTEEAPPVMASQLPREGSRGDLLSGVCVSASGVRTGEDFPPLGVNTASADPANSSFFSRASEMASHSAITSASATSVNASSFYSSPPLATQNSSATPSLPHLRSQDLLGADAMKSQSQNDSDLAPPPGFGETPISPGKRVADNNVLSTSLELDTVAHPALRALMSTGNLDLMGASSRTCARADQTQLLSQPQPSASIESSFYDRRADEMHTGQAHAQNLSYLRSSMHPTASTHNDFRPPYTPRQMVPGVSPRSPGNSHRSRYLFEEPVPSDIRQNVRYAHGNAVASPHHPNLDVRRGGESPFTRPGLSSSQEDGSWPVWGRSSIGDAMNARNHAPTYSHGNGMPQNTPLVHPSALSATAGRYAHGRPAGSHYESMDGRERAMSPRLPYGPGSRNLSHASSGEVRQGPMATGASNEFKRMQMSQGRNEVPSPLSHPNMSQWQYLPSVDAEGAQLLSEMERIWSEPEDFLLGDGDNCYAPSEASPLGNAQSSQNHRNFYVRPFSRGCPVVTPENMLE